MKTTILKYTALVMLIATVIVVYAQDSYQIQACIPGLHFNMATRVCDWPGFPGDEDITVWGESKETGAYVPFCVETEYSNCTIWIVGDHYLSFNDSFKAEGFSSR